MDVVVVRSAKRRKTVSAQMVDGRLRVSIPSWMSKADEQRYVDDMVRRMTRRRDAESIDLPARARRPVQPHERAPADGAELGEAQLAAVPHRDPPLDPGRRDRGAQPAGWIVMVSGDASPRRTRTAS